MEPNQIDVLTFAVLCNLEQVDDAEESRFSSQLWRDIRKTDRRDRIHLNLTFFHAVTGADFDVGPRPDSDAASDFSAPNSVA